MLAERLGPFRADQVVGNGGDSVILAIQTPNVLRWDTAHCGGRCCDSKGVLNPGYVIDAKTWCFGRSLQEFCWKAPSLGGLEKLLKMIIIWKDDSLSVNSSVMQTPALLCANYERIQ